MSISPIKQCRVCGSKNLIPILSLGNQYVSDFVPTPNYNGEKAPLELLLCKDCYLLQLKHSFPKEPLYRNYWYASGVNQTMKTALADITSKAEKLIHLKAGDIVIDIGSNDSTLLRSYLTKNLKLVGFEPAKNLVNAAKVENGLIINDFFNYNDFKKNFSDAKAKVVTSIAMFYDLEDPNTFVDDIKKCLDKNGVWVNQLSYTPLMFDTNAFDNICHEHLEYYTLYSIENLLNRHDFEVLDVETNDVNGGSFRLYIGHRGAVVKPFPGAEARIKHMRDYEEQHGYNGVAVYEQFADRTRKLKKDIHDFIKNEVKDGKRVYVYGASTKGNTLLQYCGLDSKLITAAAERNPSKWGKYTIGTNIPIISEDQARKERPDFFLVLPWAFIKEFREREQDFYKNGGRFIIPLPQIKIVD